MQEFANLSSRKSCEVIVSPPYNLSKILGLFSKVLGLDLKIFSFSEQCQTMILYKLKHNIFRFALSFGLDALKNREAVTQLHREGILFSVTPMENPDDPTGPPPNLPFLEIVTEFTNKLLKQVMVQFY